MKIRFTLALLLPAPAQTLTNHGATLKVGTGALLSVAGSVQNNAGGSLLNAGTLTSDNTLLFSGTANQTFRLGAATVATLMVNNTGASKGVGHAVKE